MKLNILKYRNEFLLITLWLLIILLVNPSGDFPLNDDWCYGKSVKTLCAEGSLKLYNWGEMTLVGHVYWGYFFTSIFGFSFTVLRWSTLVLGLVTVLGVYKLFKISKVDNEIGVIATVLVVANPIFMSLSFSFMTDVSFLCITIWCVYFFIKALNGKYLFVLIASLFVCLSFTIRQLALVFPVVWLITILITQKRNKHNLIKAFLPLLIFGVFVLVFNFIVNYYNLLPERYNSKFHILINKLKNIDKNLIFYIALNCIQVIAYLGLFSLPIHLFYFKKFKFKWDKILIVLWTFLTFFLLYRYNKMLPSFQNVWIDFGVGPTTLMDDSVSFVKAPLPRLPALFWKLITFLSLFSGSVILLRLRQFLIQFLKRKPLNTISTFSLIFMVIYCSPFLIVGFYDRYLLPLFPIGVLFIAANSKLEINKPQRNISIGYISALLLFSVSATHDYMSWNRVRWQAIEKLENDGISKNKIQGGAEFVTWNFFSEVQKEWWKNVTPVYTLKFKPSPKDKIFKTYQYSRWLPGNDKIYVVLDETKKK